jgi:colicin import membrane protein
MGSVFPEEMSMAAQQETSALFSLSELMRLEQTRIAEEEEQRKAKLLAEEVARREAERLAREEERLRLSREEDQRREDAERERERVARLEAIRQAEVERARFEAEQRARLEVLTAQQQHEQKLKALETDAGKKRLSRALRLTLGLSVALVAAGALFYFGRLRPSQRYQVQTFESLLQEQRAKGEANQRALDAQNERIRELEDRVRQAREQNVAPPKLDPLPKVKLPVGPVLRGAKPAPPPPPSGGCTCADPHDPLCGCLKH